MGMATATRAWRRAAAGSDNNVRKFIGYVVVLSHCLHVGVELPVTVPVVQCMLTDMARCHVAAGPPTILFWVRYASHDQMYHLMGPGGKVLWRDISWQQSRSAF